MSGLLSVVIPYYNGEKYIGEALRSIDEQTYPKIELIIVNDGSSRVARKKLTAEVENIDTPVTILDHEENQGISAARNTGVSGANGKYIAIHDQDDVSFPERFQRQIDLLTSDPDIGTVLCNVVHIDSEGTKKRVRTFSKELENMTTEDFLRHLFESWVPRESPLPLTTEVSRAEVYETIGKYNEAFYGANDQEFIYRVATEYEIQALSEPLVKRRFHSENASLSDINLLEDERLMTNHVARLFPDLFESKTSKRDAFYYLVEARKQFNRGRYRLAVQRYFDAVRTSPRFTLQRTIRYPVKTF